MKNHYLNRGSGGSGPGCFDSSKNTQPQFVFSGDLGPAGGFQHKPDFWPTRIDSKTTQKKNSNNNNNKNNKNKNKAKPLNQRGTGPRP